MDGWIKLYPPIIVLLIINANVEGRPAKWSKPTPREVLKLVSTEKERLSHIHSSRTDVGANVINDFLRVKHVASHPGLEKTDQGAGGVQTLQ